jgi:site-specific recombinase XerD
MRIFKRSNGWWYYEVERNHPHSLKTKDAREARKLYNIIKQEYLKGRLVQLDGNRRATLVAFKNIFFEQHTDIADDTRAAYELAFKLLIDSLGGSTLLSRIDDTKIAKFKKDCLARGVKKVSVNTYLRHIRTILNKAHNWGYIPKKQAIVFYKLPKRHPRVLSRVEKIKLYQYSKKNNYEMYRIIKFALWTGARREEIFTLTWPKVHNDMADIIGKGDKERTIPLLPAAIRAMGLPQDLGYVFWHPNDLDKYTKEFKKIARACGIEDLHLHNLRHTAATDMLASGMGIEYVQEVLGHADISTTQIYTKILQKNLKREMQKMRSNRGQ